MAMRKVSRAEVWPALLLVGGCNAVLGLGDDLTEQTSTASTGSSTTSGDPSSSASAGTSSVSSSSSSTGDGGAGAGGSGAGATGAGGGGGGLPLTPCGCPMDGADCSFRSTPSLGFAPTAAGMAVTNDHLVVAGPADPLGPTRFAWIDRETFAMTVTGISDDAGEGWLAGTPGGIVAYARRTELNAPVERIYLDGNTGPLETMTFPAPLAGLTWAGPRTPEVFLAISDGDLVELNPRGGSACLIATGIEANGFGVAAGFGASRENHAWTASAADDDPAAFRYISQVGCPGGGPIPGPRTVVAGYVDATTIAASGNIVTVRAANADPGDFSVVGVRLQPPNPSIQLGSQPTNESHALVMSSTWTYFPRPDLGLMRCDHSLGDCQTAFPGTLGEARIHNMALAADEQALYVAYEDGGGDPRVACIDLTSP